MMRRLLWLLCGLVLGVCLTVIGWPAGAVPPRPDLAPLPAGAGVAVGWDCCTASEVSQLHPVAFTDYHPSPFSDCINLQHGIAAIPNATRISMAWSWMPDACLQTEAARLAPDVWQISNEPGTPGQDNCGTPQACAARFRQMAAAIRAGDPRARIIGPGLAECSLWWADQLLAAGGVVWDAWSCHAYSTRSDAADVLAKVRDFRAWQFSHYGDNRPLVLSETGIYPGIAESIAPQTLQALRAGLPGAGITTWLWFSARAGGRWPGDLLTSGGTLTATGRAFVGGPARYWRRLVPAGAAIGGAR